MLANHSLAPPEQDRLEQCEAIIERGLQTFYEVGKALQEIRDAKLYRDTHQSFATYCRERWQMGRNYAYKQIQASTVVDNLTVLPPGTKNLQNVYDRTQFRETHIRPLAPLTPAQQREAWCEVQRCAETKPVTEKLVRTVVKKCFPETIKPKPSSKPNKAALELENEKLKAENETLKAELIQLDKDFEVRVASTVTQKISDVLEDYAVLQSERDRLHASWNDKAALLTRITELESEEGVGSRE